MIKGDFVVKAPRPSKHERLVSFQCTEDELNEVKDRYLDYVRSNTSGIDIREVDLGPIVVKSSRIRFDETSAYCCADGHVVYTVCISYWTDC